MDYIISILVSFLYIFLCSYFARMLVFDYYKYIKKDEYLKNMKFKYTWRDEYYKRKYSSVETTANNIDLSDGEAKKDS